MNLPIIKTSKVENFSKIWIDDIYLEKEERDALKIDFSFVRVWLFCYLSTQSQILPIYDAFILGKHRFVDR